MGPEALIRDKIKQKRHREGYEDGLSSSHKAASALAFIASDSPVEMLGQYTKLVLDGADSWKVGVNLTGCGSVHVWIHGLWRSGTSEGMPGCLGEMLLTLSSLMLSIGHNLSLCLSPLLFVAGGGGCGERQGDG